MQSLSQRDEVRATSQSRAKHSPNKAGKSSRARFSALVPGLSIAVTGVTNLLAPMTVQLVGGTTALGQFTLVSIPYVIALSVQRQVLSQNVSRGALIANVRGLPVACMSIVSFATAGAMLTALILGPETWLMLIALSIPFSLAQDILRYIFFGQRQAVRALLSDLIWFTSVVALFLTTLNTTSEARSANSYLTWACVILLAAPAASMAVAMILSVFTHWQNRNIVTASLNHLLVESVSIFAAGQVTQYSAAAILSIEALGQYKSILLLFTPITLLSNSVQASILPRLDITAKRPVHRAARALSCAVAITGTAVIIFGLTDPLQILERLRFDLGTSFLATAIILCTATTLAGYLSIYLVKYRVDRAASYWLRVRMAAALADPIVSIPMTFMLGTAGIATGTLTSNLLTAILVRSDLAQNSTHQGTVERVDK